MKLNVNGNFLKGFLRKTGDVISKNSPIIAASLGVIGLGCAIYSAIKATPKAMQMIEEAEIEKNNEEMALAQEQGRGPEIVPLTKKEKAIIYGKCFWKTAALTVVTAGCIIGGVVLANRQTKAMTLLYGTAATTLEQYREAAKEVVGEKKERSIHDKVVSDKFSTEALDNDEMIIDTGHGTHLCVDAITGRAFYSDIETIRRSINNLNAQLISVGQLSLNDYFYELGLSEIKYDYASMLGWRYDSPYGYGRQIEVTYTSDLTPKGKPYLIVEVQTAPKFIDSEIPWN